MTKQEYIMELMRALSFLDHDTRNAALDFYNEMLEDRLEEAETEEAAVAAMDSPDMIAAQLRQEMAAPADRPAAPVSASDDLTEEWSPRTFNCPLAGLHAVKLDAENMAIEILPASDGQVTLSYFTRKQDEYTARVDGDVLTLTHRSDPSWARRIVHNFFFRPAAPVKVTLRLPEDAALDLSAVTRNAVIEARGMRGLGILDLKSSNGSLTAETVKCREAVLRTSNARVTLRDAVCGNVCRLQSSNGSIILENCGAAGSVECVTSNAAARAENVRCGDTLLLRTSNGSIQARDVSAQSVTLHSSNGSLLAEDLRANAVSLRTSNASIRGVLPGAQQDWQIDSGTTNGKNSLPASQPGQKPLSAHTSNGSIQITFGG